MYLTIAEMCSLFSCSIAISQERRIGSVSNARTRMTERYRLNSRFRSIQFSFLSHLHHLRRRLRLRHQSSCLHLNRLGSSSCPFLSSDSRLSSLIYSYFSSQVVHRQSNRSLEILHPKLLQRVVSSTRCHSRRESEL